MRSFADHLDAPSGKGALKDWPHTGAAGGAACGDLVRISLRIEGDRVAEVGFDAEGCGAVTAASSAVVELVEAGRFLEAARIGPGDVADALGGLTPSKRHAAELAVDALHRALGKVAKAGGLRLEPSSRRTLAAKAGGLRLEPSSRRTLVAMSGGVDSAAAAQLALDAGDEVVAVTLELWADPATDGELSCCSPQAVRGARELAHRMGIPHVTLDLRERFPAEVVERFLDGGPRLRRPGPIVDRDGRVLGRHEGHHNYTVGQRRGLGVAAPEPVYVLEKDAATNTVVVGSKDELATTRVPLDEVTLHRDPGQVETVRLRYHAHPIACRVLVRENGGMEVELERAAHAVAPGQLACLMSKDRVVGEGTIGEPR